MFCSPRRTAAVSYFGLLCIFLAAFASKANAQENHDHVAPEKLGVVSFRVSCRPNVQNEFNRGVALLHSFAYSAAETAFRQVSEQDPACAMAHWGAAMTYFHQLWEPQLAPSTISIGRQEIERARTLGTRARRETRFIEALRLIYLEDAVGSYPTRVNNYARAVCEIAQDEPADPESQVFCALALLSSASPLDKSHANQKRAASLLEPLFGRYPQHPGVPHYLIHAYDNSELASRGLTAARVYSQIAPSAPHALHMPSHIFTRLGFWQDSVASNLAARNAAKSQGDIGEELHAMDYLVYAYLQLGRERDASQIVSQIADVATIKVGEFKVRYAATAMPIRYLVERGKWLEATRIPLPTGAPPQVVGIAIWAQGLGFARTGHVPEAEASRKGLLQIGRQLSESGNEYWSLQTEILASEIESWLAQSSHRPEEALALMRKAADDEDSIEKLPVTPGPILPAREQLGHLLLEQNQPAQALEEFRSSLLTAPGRRGAQLGAERAALR